MKRAVGMLLQEEKLIYQNLGPKDMSYMGKKGKIVSQGAKAKIHLFMHSSLIQQAFIEQSVFSRL